MAQAVKKGGKKNRKFGKNLDYCKTYRAADLERRNKKRRMGRHLRHFPQNLAAQRDYDQLFGTNSSQGVLAAMTIPQKKRVERRVRRKRLRDQWIKHHRPGDIDGNRIDAG